MRESDLHHTWVSRGIRFKLYRIDLKCVGCPCEVHENLCFTRKGLTDMIGTGHQLTGSTFPNVVMRATCHEPVDDAQSIMHQMRCASRLRLDCWGLTALIRRTTHRDTVPHIINPPWGWCLQLHPFRRCFV
jgi:hypothetical protein